MADFLLEIGLEEVPARMLAGAEAELARRTEDLLRRERLLGEEFAVESYSTPRRLAVLVRGVLQKQADTEEELLGPPVKAAYRDGKPTAAAEAFAKKAGVAVDELRTVTNAKGEYLAATAKRAGRDFAAIVAEELPNEIASIYWAKNMYWRPGKPERFVRPVQWLLAMLDGEVVPLEWGGRTASNVTYGHRVLHGSAPVTVHQSNDYISRLNDAKVMAKVEERRHRIRKALDHACRAVPDARWREDHPLVDKVTHMTEWPSVILGSFEPQYLRLPEEVLVTVMRDHQNYFAMEGKDGKLLPYFLAVLNTEPDANAEGIIRHGNERVLRARFNDAAFFYDFDQRTPLRERVTLLENITFQKDLGSYAAKTVRIRAVAERLAAHMSAAALDREALDTAAQLCKADLTTDMVKEFTELQGIVGGLYARAQGYSAAVTDAIYAHYQPVGMEDAIPPTVEGQVLALADKIDTIAGMFGLGLQPTGSKDPFALRRAANGIVKILAEGGLPLTLSQVVDATGSAGANRISVRTFFAERLESYLREVRGAAYDVVKAVLSTAPDDVRDALARVDAVAQVRGSDDFLAIAAAFKRMKNILEQARAKGERVLLDVDSSLLTEPAERTLADESARRATRVAQLREQGNYAGALATIAELRPAIDVFFEKVMVMVTDAALRRARLGLLARVLGDFNQVADFSEIVIAG